MVHASRRELVPFSIPEVLRGLEYVLENMVTSKSIQWSLAVQCCHELLA